MPVKTLRSPFMVHLRPRLAPSGEKVGLVDPPGPKAVHGSQPTNQDVLDVIQDLSKKISQLSKNQQILASKLDQIESTVGDNYSNIIAAANYGVAWQVVIYNLTTGIGQPNPSPHWAS